MRKLILTPDIRWAWNEVRWGYGSKAPGQFFLARCQDFVNAVMEYANDTEKEDGTVIRYTRILGKNGKVTKIVSGLPAPTVRYGPAPSSDVAEWRYGPVENSEEEIENVIVIARSPSTYLLRTALVREVLHVLDYMAGIPSHEYWRERFKAMQTLFPSK